MDDIRNLKCKCCHCWDSYEGCQGFDCDVDYKLSIHRVKETAKEYGVSIEVITAMLVAEENKRLSSCNDEDDYTLPDDFDPETDTQFLISFSDAVDLDKKRLVDMDIEDLKRLRAELNFVLEMRENE